MTVPLSAELIWRDVRHAARMIRRFSGRSAAIIVTLATGIGATTVAFAVLQAAVLRPLPYRDPGHLASVALVSPDVAGPVPSGVPSVVLSPWSHYSHSVVGFGTYATGQLGLFTADGEPMTISGAFVSSGLLSLLGVPSMTAGRAFRSSDALPGTPPLAILSYPLWTRLGSDPAAVGRVVRLSLGDYQVIGIMSPRFLFPAANVTPDILIAHDPPQYGATFEFVDVLARLAPGATVGAADEDLRAIYRRSRDAYPPTVDAIVESGIVPRVEALQERLTADARAPLLLALGAALCVLLLACANVASLVIARMEALRAQIALRVALGARASQASRVFLSEIGLLTLAGAVTALGIAAVASAVLRRALSGTFPGADQIAISWLTLAALGVSTLVTVGACTAAVMSFRLGEKVPGPRMLDRPSLIASQPPPRARSLLVAAQTAVSVALTILACLFLAALMRLTGRQLGFAPRDLATAKVSALGLGRSKGERDAAVARILQRLEAQPGIALVGASTALPLQEHAFHFTVPVAGLPPPPSFLHDAVAVDAVSPRFFQTMRDPFLQGRDFLSGDGPDAERVAIVNEAFSRVWAPRTLEIGARLSLGGDPEHADIRIVGIVGDMKDRGPREQAEPTVYVPFAQAAPQLGWNTVAIAVRTTTRPGEWLPRIRSTLTSLAPRSAVYDLATMDERLSAHVASAQELTTTFVLVATVAVMLTTVGLYALSTSLLGRKQRELAVRVALGASRRQVALLAVRQGLAPVAAGLPLGLLAASLAARIAESQLFGVRPTDTVVYAAGAAVAVGIAGLAAVIPALRASMVDPIPALRSE